MRVLLTHAYFLADDPKEQDIMRPYAPLGIQYVAAYLNAHGITASLFDTTFSTKEKFRNHIVQTRPDVIGIYTNLMTKLNVLEALAFIKSRPELAGTRVVLGGPEVTHHAENFLAHGADVLVIGEGEETMRELVETWSSPLPLALANVHGIAYRDDNGHVVRTPERALISKLDTLPFPMREGIEIERYLETWKQHHGMSMVSVSTMRGCPYSCRWCSRAVYGASYRRRSAKLIVDELELIRDRYAPDSIWFVDDVFTINHRWLEEFAGEVRGRGVRIPYECITRADRLNERAVQLLKESGCFRVWIGAESGSQRILDAMDRRVTVEQVRQMIGLAHAHGIETGTFIMLGYPGETEQDILQTIDHLKQSAPDHFTVTIAYPITGTPLFGEVSAAITEQPEWNVSTDRDIDFERTYSHRYYRFALSRMRHEVAASKLARNGRALSLQRARHGAIAVAAAAGMRWERLFGQPKRKRAVASTTATTTA